ncbi:MAG: DUF309 domain-containing protein [Campylobacterota bacterium]|nr:DUF309 domain-containing protein [Campylobacterota bacterium]
MNIEKSCDLFMQMVKDEHYAQAHETLEHEWKELKKTDRPHSQILKGLINGATSFEIKRRGKPLESALRIWAVYEKYKPLIVQLNTPHTEKYQECGDLLEKTYQKVFET